MLGGFGAAWYMATQSDEFQRLVTRLVDEHRRQVDSLVADVNFLQKRLGGLETCEQRVHTAGSELESYLDGGPLTGQSWVSEEAYDTGAEIEEVREAPQQLGLSDRIIEHDQASTARRTRPPPINVPGLSSRTQAKSPVLPTAQPCPPIQPQTAPHAAQLPHHVWQYDLECADQDEATRSTKSPAAPPSDADPFSEDKDLAAKPKTVTDSSRASSPSQQTTPVHRVESEATSCSLDLPVVRAAPQQPPTQTSSFSTAPTRSRKSISKRATFVELSSENLAASLSTCGESDTPGARTQRLDSAGDDDAMFSSWALLRSKFRKEDGSNAFRKSLRKSKSEEACSTKGRESKRASSFSGRMSTRNSSANGKLNVQRAAREIDCLTEGDGLTKVVRLAASVAKMTASLDAKMLESTAEDGFKLRATWEIDENEMMRIKANHMRTNGLKLARANTKLSLLSDAEHPSSSAAVVLQPQCRARLMWDILAVVMLSYDCIMLPMQVFELPDSFAFAMMTWVGVLYWTLDIGASFITGVYINGELEMDLKKVVLYYVKGWFPFDLAVVAPEWVSIFMGDESETVSSSGMARTLRGGRIFRFIRFIRLLRLVKVQRVLGDLKARINSSYMLVALSIAKLVIATLVMVHALACTWYFFGDQEEGWVYIEGIQNQTLQERYLYSFQWSLTRLHPTNMSENMDLRTVSERMLAIFATLIAMVVSSLFISSITNTMAQLSTLRQSRNRKMQAFRDYVRQYQVSPQLTVRVKKYIDRTSDSRQGNCEEELAKTLPGALLQELRYEAMYPIVINHGLFHSFHTKHPRAEWDLCYKVLKANSAFPSEVIFTTGDACSRMFFIVAGEMTYSKEREMSSAQAARRGARGEGITHHAKEQLVVPISWLCEAVLWTTWFNCGELLSIGDSIFIEVSALAFGALIKDHEPAMIDAVIWARCFVDDLNNTPALELTDCAHSAHVGRDSMQSMPSVVGKGSVSSCELMPVLAAWD